MKKAFVLLAALTAFTVSAASQRIAVVDLRRVFKEYYKSRIAEEFIKQQAESARLYLGQLTKQLESLRAEARRLGTNAMNQALDPALKAKADADINIIVTESGIDNLKSRLSKGNYLLTESITFTFENNTLKFY